VKFVFGQKNKNHNKKIDNHHNDGDIIELDYSEEAGNKFSV